jgi:hypothetical protein
MTHMAERTDACSIALTLTSKSYGRICLRLGLSRWRTDEPVRPEVAGDIDP